MTQAPQGQRFLRHKTYTTFLAVPISDENSEYIMSLQNQLMKKWDREIVWEIPQKLHITLLYLGRITNEQQHLVFDTATELYRNQPSFSVSIGHINYFYNKHSDSVVWLSVYDTESVLINMHRELVRELNAQNFSLSEKKLVPHITIGRLKKMRELQKKQILDEVSSYEISEYPRMSVDHLQLLQSNYEQHMDTSLYTVLDEIDLSS